MQLTTTICRDKSAIAYSHGSWFWWKKSGTDSGPYFPVQPSCLGSIHFSHNHVKLLIFHCSTKKCGWEKKQTSWWFQPIWKIFSQIGSFPQVLGENKKYLSCHHLEKQRMEKKSPSFPGFRLPAYHPTGEFFLHLSWAKLTVLVPA